LLGLLLLLRLLLGSFLSFLFLSMSDGSPGHGTDRRTLARIPSNRTDRRTTSSATRRTLYRGALPRLSGLILLLTLLSRLRVLAGRRLNLGGVVTLGFILRLLVLRLTFVGIRVDVKRSGYIALPRIRGSLLRRRRSRLLRQQRSAEHGGDD
jgi:hypothetical protein